MTTAALDAVLGKLHTAGLPKWHQYVKPGYPVQIAAPQKHIIEVLVAVRGGYEAHNRNLRPAADHRCMGEAANKLSSDEEQACQWALWLRTGGWDSKNKWLHQALETLSEHPRLWEAAVAAVNSQKPCNTVQEQQGGEAPIRQPTRRQGTRSQGHDPVAMPGPSAPVVPRPPDASDLARTAATAAAGGSAQQPPDEPASSRGTVPSRPVGTRDPPRRAAPSRGTNHSRRVSRSLPPVSRDTQHDNAGSDSETGPGGKKKKKKKLIIPVSASDTEPDEPGNICFDCKQPSDGRVGSGCESGDCEGKVVSGTWAAENHHNEIGPLELDELNYQLRKKVGHTTAKYKGRVHVGYYMTALVGGHDGTTRNTNGADGSGRHRLFVRLPDVEYKDPVYAWACCSATGGAPAKLLTKVGGGNLTVLKGYLQTRAQQVASTSPGPTEIIGYLKTLEVPQLIISRLAPHITVPALEYAKSDAQAKQSMLDKYGADICDVFGRMP